MYLDAVETTFGSEVDFSQLVKIYGSNPESEVRYSPAECIGIEKIISKEIPIPSMFRQAMWKGKI